MVQGYKEEVFGNKEGCCDTCAYSKGAYLNLIVYVL